jgi:parallel beta-helix repeat protein
MYITVCKNLVMSGCLCTSNSNYALQLVSYCHNAALTNCIGRSMSLYGIYLMTACANVVLTNCTGSSVSSWGMALASGSDNCTLTGCTGSSLASFGISLADASPVTATNCTFSDSYHATNAAFRVSASFVKNVRLLGCRLSATVPLTLQNTYGGGAIMAFRSAASGDAGLLKWFASDMDLTGSYPLGTSLGLPTKDLWVETPACWVPGLSAYGATTITTTLNGGTVATQYRVSHDYGLTYSAYAAVPATITDSPNQDGEYIQFRVSKTDSGATVPVHSGISVVVTFVNGWTMPALSPSIITAAPVIGSRVVRGVNAL